jgi:hypothetical protein
MKLNTKLKKVKQSSCKLFNRRYSLRRVNGNSKSISAIRGGYLAEIEAKQKDIADLREKLKRLAQVDKESEPLFAPPDKYRNIGLTAAVIDAVSALHRTGAADADGVSAAQVRNFLAAHGFKQPQDFDVAVHVTLSRLSARNDERILLSRDSGKKRYKPNNTFNEIISGTGGEADRPKP